MREMNSTNFTNYQPIMKKIQYILVLLFCAMLFQSTAWGQQTAEFFYYYQNQQQPLELCTEKVLVKFKGDISKEQKQRILGQNSLLASKWMKPMAGVDVVPVRHGVTANQLMASLREMEGHSSIAYVHPFFWVAGTDKPLTYRDDIIVRLTEGVDRQWLEALAEANSMRVGQVLSEEYRAYQLVLTDPSGTQVLQQANSFHHKPEIEFAEPNLFGEHPGNYVPNDPFYNRQYSIRNTGANPGVGGTAGADMRVESAWDITTGCADIVIAILDDGVDLNHPDLVNQLVPGFDALGQNSQGMRFPGDTHGTACAGTAAAEGDNNIGVAGVAYDCSIMPVRVFSDTFGASNVTFYDGFFFAATNGADILSNSWGWGQSNLIDLGIWIAANFGRAGKGCVILASSGNSNRTTVGYPARNSNVIAVGAGNYCDERKRTTDSQAFLDDTTTCGDGNTADPQGVSCDMDSCWGSNYGIAQELLAPGISVYTTFENNGYGWFQGTSAACPNAAGVAGLVLSANPSLEGLEVREILNTTARKLNSYFYISFPILWPYGTWNPEVGYGVPHAQNAVQEALKKGTVYVQNETFQAPPLADFRRGEYEVIAGRSVTNTLPQGEVKIQPPAPITLFEGGKRVVIKPGFRASQQTLFTARVFDNGCPVKQ